MHAQDQFLTYLLQGPKQFLIPIFQRTYSWKESNCAQLLQDICRVGKSEHVQSHFVGSLVLISNQQSNASIPQWQVIDGQQRLTTVTLLISALLQRAHELGLAAVGSTPLAAVREYYLLNTYGQGDARYKLLLTQGDKPALCALVDHKPLPETGAPNVRHNFEFFCESLTDAEMIEQVYRGLQKIKVVEVILQAGQDDPQAIFESLNSTGVDLSQADLIRNYVLMRQPHEVQSRLYAEIWFPMEQLFGEAYASKFDRFAQDFLTLVTESNSLLKAGDVYALFKEWFGRALESADVDTLLGRIFTHTRYYAAYSLLQERDAELRAAFADLRTLVEVATPAIMRLYDLYDAAKLAKSDFVAAVRLLESYILRRSVCDMQTRSLGNIFAALAQKISDEAPLESLRVAVARFSKNSRFPNDTEFFEALIHKELYESRICRFVLERLENDSKEKISTREFSIEHVMPQNENLPAAWRQMLGADWQQAQQTWLHRLGNLTLTGYNSEYSDKDFLTKKSIPRGFNESPLRLNRDMREAERWTVEEMRQRGERLANQAVELWPALKVDPALIAEYELAERKRLTEGLSLEDVSGLNKKTETLFKALEAQVMALGQDVSLIIGRKNLTFYTLVPFLQVIPRRHGLALVLALDHEELPPELQERCSSTSEWSFIANATLGGVYWWLQADTDLPSLVELLQEAYDQALA